MRRLAFLAALLLPSTALAQGTSKAAMAESLFQEARKLLAAGKTSPACSKFKASFLIDPTNGTLLALAHCHQKEGRTASAWAEFQEVATEAKRAGKPDQERYAREQTAVLDKILRRVTIRVQPMDGMKVRVDGVELPPEALGSALPVDPGARVFEVSAPRYVTSTQTIVVEPGPGTTEVTFDPLVAEPVAAPPPALAPAAPPATAPAAERRSFALPLPVAGGIMVAGAALAGVGAYAQLVVARGEHERSVRLMRQAWDPRASADARDEAVTWSAVGITGLAVGAAALLFGGYMGYRSIRPSEAPGASGSLVVAPTASTQGAGITCWGAL